MTLRRKNFEGTREALVRALERREALLAKLVRTELDIRTLKKRLARQQKKRNGAYDPEADPHFASPDGAVPYRFEPIDTDGDLDDPIPDLTAECLQ